MPKKQPARKPSGAAKPNRSSQASAPNRSGSANLGPNKPQTQLTGDEAPSTPHGAKDPQLLFPKKADPELLPVGDTLDEFQVIERSPDQKGNVDSWAGDLVGRRLSVTGSLAVSGWAVDDAAGLPAAEVLVARRGKIIARSPVNLSRPDVATAKSVEAYRDSGWTIAVSGHSLGVGDHELEVSALMQDNSSVVRLGSKTVRVCPLCQPDANKQVLFDKIIAKRLLRECASRDREPSVGSKKWPKMNVDDVTIQDGELRIHGWALSPVGIARIKVYINDKLVGLCFCGQLRPDARKSYPFINQSESSGFNLTTQVFIHETRTSRHLRVQAIDRTGSCTEFATFIN